MATIHGTPGHDRADLGGQNLVGTAQADYIYGYAGDDYIEGRGGNDSLYGGTGNRNSIFGGGGNDYVHSEGVGGYFDGGAGVDRLALMRSAPGSFDLGAGWGSYGSAVSDRFTMLRFEHMTTGSGNDTITGSGASNHIMSGAGDDEVNGLGGADTIYTEAGNDYANGGGGNDTINGGLGDDEIFGGAGSDSLEGHDGNDLVWGGLGNDIVSGGRGNDTLDGGEGGFDTASYAGHAAAVTADLRVSSAYSNVLGVAEQDMLFRIDKLVGSFYDDWLIANTASELDGGSGNDILFSNAGANRLTGGGGVDTLAYTLSNAGVNVNLASNAASGGHAQGDVLSGFESVRGSGHADTLRLGANGGTLDGLAGNDTMTGGGGSDKVIGGAGYDVMTGGAGPDFFLFTSTSDSPWSNASDRITDFVRGSDKIDLGALDANAHVGGNQAFHTVFSTPTPYSDANFTAGSIAYMDGSVNGASTTLVMVNTSDNLSNGLDRPEIVFLLDGDINLTLSDFIL
jgi:Ca2+-binding RTX toxin-like protein